MAKGKIVDGHHLIKKGYTVDIKEHEHPAYYIVLKTKLKKGLIPLIKST